MLCYRIGNLIYSTLMTFY